MVAEPLPPPVPRIDTPEQARELAERLLAPARDRPVVVVSTPHGEPEPWLDVPRLVAEAGSRADVCVLVTGPASWAFAEVMPERIGVYGGAGRVYPTGQAWAADPGRSPLRLARHAPEGPSVTERLLADLRGVLGVPSGPARPAVVRPVPPAPRPLPVPPTLLPGPPGPARVPGPARRQGDRPLIKQLQLSNDTLRAANATLRDEVERGRDQVADLTRERDGLAGEVEKLRAELAEVTRDRDALRERCSHLDAERQRWKQEARAQRDSQDPTGADEDAFADPEEQFRHEVYLAWARRIPKGEKASRPLPAYALGPRFLSSLQETGGVDRAKVVQVVVEVLTGLAAELDGRCLHPLRQGAGGDERPVTREDGAVCWRVALQRESPAARRLHFWRRGGEVELSRVVLHDDTDP
ncbi:MAG: hypothetical protein ACOYY2_07315 [Actinomycetota bacterium]